MNRLWFILIILLMAGSVQAASIQYFLPTGDVTGANEVGFDPTPIHGVVNLPEPVSAIIWPPPSGCSVGKPDWTRITDPSAVTAAGIGMIVKPTVIVFTTSSPLLTGCHQVTGWPQLRALVETTIINAVKANELVMALNELNVATFVRCPATDVTAPCVSARADMASLNTSYPLATPLSTFLGQVVDLRNDAVALKTAQGW
jgi:hypothetical protein